MRILLSLLSLAVSTLIFSQARITINNDAYISMNGGTVATPVFIVLDNPNDNALSTTGSGGNLISENEYNKVRWNIGTSAGSYSIPFTTGTGTNVKIPYLLQITAAGAGGSHIDFSTFPTNIMNFVRPSTVTHMLDALTATVDNSMWAIDRFWMVDAMNYATRPSASMIFDYDPNETIGNNLFPGNMTAQRFDSNQNEWNGSQSLSGGAFGSDNLALTQVEGVSVPSADFYEAWTLTDTQNLLPVELTYFSAECMTDFVDLNWETASELNASHFNVEKSLDGNTWEVITTSQAQGTTSNSTHYGFRDYNPTGTVAYYRLVQYDFDGQFKVYDAQSVNPCGANNLSIEVSNMSDNKFQIKISSPDKQSFQMNLWSINGQNVRESEKLDVIEGENIFMFDGNSLSTGIYAVSVHNETENKIQKLIIQ